MSGVSWGSVADVAAAVFLLAGAFLAFAAGVGVLRFPDLLARIHTATKPQVLGMIFMLLALALRLRDASSVWILILVVLFQMLTSPVGAHMVGRAGYRTGKVRRDLLEVDEFTEDLQAATAAEREATDDEPDADPVGDRPADDRPADDRPADDVGADDDQPPTARPAHPGAGRPGSGGVGSAIGRAHV